MTVYEIMREVVYTQGGRKSFSSPSILGSAFVARYLRCQSPARIWGKGNNTTLNMIVQDLPGGRTITYYCPKAAGK